jgi:hypothetical protein
MRTLPGIGQPVDRAYLRLNVSRLVWRLRVELVGHGNVISRQVEQVAAPAFVVLPPGSFGEFDGVAAIDFCAAINDGEGHSIGF